MRYIAIIVTCILCVHGAPRILYPLVTPVVIGHRSSSSLSSYRQKAGLYVIHCFDNVVLTLLCDTCACEYGCQRCRIAHFTIVVWHLFYIVISVVVWVVFVCCLLGNSGVFSCFLCVIHLGG